MPDISNIADATDGNKPVPISDGVRDLEAIASESWLGQIFETLRDEEKEKCHREWLADLVREAPSEEEGRELQAQAEYLDIWCSDDKPALQRAYERCQAATRAATRRRERRFIARVRVAQAAPRRQQPRARSRRSTRRTAASASDGDGDGSDGNDPPAPRAARATARAIFVSAPPSDPIVVSDLRLRSTGSAS